MRDFEHKDNWERLRHETKRRKVAFFLGAGVCRPSGLPDWPKLAEIMAGNDAKEFASLVPETAFELFKIREGDKWIEYLRETLYREFKRRVDASKIQLRSLGEKDKKTRKRAHQFFLRNNPSLVHYVEACSIPQDGAFVENPRIGAVLTTNIDWLVQACDSACHGDRILRTLERATVSAHPYKIPLYHLHGYIMPWNLGPSHECPDRIVFTEGEYLERNDNPNHWANVVLHWALREFIVIFIGCSMTDPLIRRALYRTRLERMRDWKAERAGRREPGEGESRRHFAITCHSEKGTAVDRLFDKSWSQLGIWPLWVRDYEGDMCRRSGGLRDMLRLPPKRTRKVPAEP